MKFAKGFEQFLDLMSLLSGMLMSLEEDEQDYKFLLHEKAYKLEPYIKKAYPVITELYSVPPQEAYEIFKEATRDIPKQTFQEIRTFASQCVSGEFVSEMFDNDEEEKQYIENELHNLIASLRVYSMNMIANNRYQTSLNQLVFDATNGDDQSLFLAIHIEPLAEYIPSISERISHAEMIGQNHFLEQLNKSRIARRDDKRQRNNRLNYFLVLFHRFRILEQLTQPQMAEIFINRLDVYDKDDSSLFKYISRWKKSLNRYETRQENKQKTSKT